VLHSPKLVDNVIHAYDIAAARISLSLCHSSRLLYATYNILASPPFSSKHSSSLSLEETGTIRLKGMQSEAIVYRDSYGVIHITADNEHDLFFAQGVVSHTLL